MVNGLQVCHKLLRMFFFFFFVVISIKLFFLSNIHKFTEVKSHLNTVRLPP